MIRPWKIGLWTCISTQYLLSKAFSRFGGGGGPNIPSPKLQRFRPSNLYKTGIEALFQVTQLAWKDGNFQFTTAPSSNLNQIKNLFISDANSVYFCKFLITSYKQEMRKSLLYHCTIVNRALPSLHGGSVENQLTNILTGFLSI